MRDGFEVVTSEFDKIHPPPRNLTNDNGTSTIWRCISHWTWGFSNVIVSFQGCILNYLDVLQLSLTVDLKFVCAVESFFETDRSYDQSDGHMHRSTQIFCSSCQEIPPKKGDWMTIPYHFHPFPEIVRTWSFFSWKFWQPFSTALCFSLMRLMQAWFGHESVLEGSGDGLHISRLSRISSFSS